ncbi:MAG: AraC family transcriptional regulator [Ancrocorticia sp.]
MTVTPDDPLPSPEGMYEEQHLDSPYVECVWRAKAVRSERYLVAAVEYWDMWFSRQPGGEIIAALSGPTVGHRWVESVVGEYGWGVQLRAHIVVPGVSARLVLGGEERLPVRDGRVTIAGHDLPVPEYEELEAFVTRLIELDVLRSDDDVRRVLIGDDAGYSERHWQRRVRGATGLTRKQIAQLARAREAFTLLQQGVSPAECAARCGFSDQAHLTRSLRAFHGLTPARILAGQ